MVENEINGGMAIACNLLTPILKYTAQITTLPLWSAKFINALAWLLVTEIAAPLSANPKYAEAAGKAYEAAILSAGAQNMNEGVEREAPTSEFLTARL